ncbi:MAG: glycosyltransferase family 39 protein [Acidobacteria bacterium]|nr:glycosyltransferase family 39 protein [Acidobacteriota bacterium]
MPRRIAPYLVITLVGGVFFFYGLGSFGLLGPDEPRYAQVAREMVRSGDLVTPRTAGIPWFEKPVLLFWFQAGAMAVAGANEGSARVPSAIAALLMMICLFLTGRSIRSSRFGLLAAVIFGSNLLVPAFARGASHDMLLTAAIGTGLYLFFLAQEGGRIARRWALPGFYGSIGLALLAKGLVGAVIPGIILIGYLIWARRAGVDIRLQAGWGAVIVLLVAGLWYFPMALRHGWMFIDEFIINHHLRRFTSDRFHHPGPFYYYLPILAVGLLPWSAFLVPSAVRAWASRSASDDPVRRLIIYGWIWILVPTVFFSVSSSKLPGYILPVVPAASLLIAFEVEALLDGQGSVLLRRCSLVTPWLYALIAIAGLVYARSRIGLPFAPALTAGLGLSALAALAFLSARRNRPRWYVAVLVMNAAVLLLFVKGWIMPAVATLDSMKAPAEELLVRMRPGEPIAGYFVFPHGLTFYTDARGIYDRLGNPAIYQSPEELIALLKAYESVIVVTPPAVLPGLRSDLRLHAELLLEHPEYVFVRLKSSVGP